MIVCPCFNSLQSCKNEAISLDMLPLQEKNPGLPEVLHELYVHCYFVSRLMELHNPPIELWWDRAGVDVFPDLK